MKKKKSFLTSAFGILTFIGIAAYHIVTKTIPQPTEIMSAVGALGTALAAKDYNATGLPTDAPQQDSTAVKK